VVQAGYRNRFGHPAPEVLARYRERGIAVVASPQCGAWLWHGESENAAGASCLREVRRRYWHHGADEASAEAARAATTDAARMAQSVAWNLLP